MWITRKTFLRISNSSTISSNIYLLKTIIIKRRIKFIRKGRIIKINLIRKRELLKTLIIKLSIKLIWKGRII